MMTTPHPEIPFQQTVVDLFDLEGHQFIVYADHYSGWIEAAKLSNSRFCTVKKFFLRWFAAFGVPEEISSDGGPPFNSAEYRTLLRTWNITQRLSSAYYAQSNGRAEAAVKSIKRLLQGAVDSRTGELNTDAAVRALLTHRNTPNQDTNMSPAVALFGHPIRDHLPQPKTLRKEWHAILSARELAMAKRHLRSQEQRRSLVPLKINDVVAIQNQTGNRPKKWHSTGYIADTLPNRQYKVVVDGSRRVSLRNRKFLRKIDPICRKMAFDSTADNSNNYNGTPETPQAPTLMTQIVHEEPRDQDTASRQFLRTGGQQPMPTPPCHSPVGTTYHPPIETSNVTHPPIETSNVTEQLIETSDVIHLPIRRSNRLRKKPARLIEET